MIQSKAIVQNTLLVGVTHTHLDRTRSIRLSGLAKADCHSRPSHAVYSGSGISSLRTSLLFVEYAMDFGSKGREEALLARVYEEAYKSHG